jgi:hypothetical protein
MPYSFSLTMLRRERGEHLTLRSVRISREAFNFTVNQGHHGYLDDPVWVN